MKSFVNSTQSNRLPVMKSWLLPLLTVGALALFSTGVVAKPDCNANPDHPSCGGDSGGDGSGGLDAYTANNGTCVGADAELFGDTRDFEGPGTGYQQCQNDMAGSSVPNNTRDLFTDFQRCIIPMTVPGIGSEILLVKASFSSHRDRNSGDIFAVQLFFHDDNGAEYQSDVLSINPPVTPDAAGYVFPMDLTAPITPKGGGRNRDPVGTVCIDEVIYEPAP